MVGKTHLATAIVYAATQQRIKTKFITASDLMIQLESAQSQNKIDSYLKRAIGIPRLLVIDEFGYVKFLMRHRQIYFSK